MLVEIQEVTSQSSIITIYKPKSFIVTRTREGLIRQILSEESPVYHKLWNLKLTDSEILKCIEADPLA